MVQFIIRFSTDTAEPHGTIRSHQFISAEHKAWWEMGTRYNSQIEICQLTVKCHSFK